jgi:hypothetical protein
LNAALGLLQSAFGQCLGVAGNASESYFWNDLRQRADIQSALRGVNAAVVGLLLAALYTPVWTSAIGRLRDCGGRLPAAGILEGTALAGCCAGRAGKRWRSVDCLS